MRGCWKKAFSGNLCTYLCNAGKYFRWFIFYCGYRIRHVSLFSYVFPFSGRRKIMSSISGVDSNSLLNTLLRSINNSASSTSSQTTESDGTDTQQTTSESAATLTTSLVDQLKNSILQNQYSFMTSLLNSDESASSDSLTSLLQNSESANNSQFVQLSAALNISSSSSGSDDLTTNLLQSLASNSLSQSNIDSIKSAMENLLKSYGSDINSSTKEILNKYISLLADTSLLIKTTA
jgi:hypothetical protein